MNIEPLREDQLALIFDEEIKPTTYALESSPRADPNAKPRVILVGGQPGSGKTELMALARLNTPRAHEINGDELRRFHPQYDEIMRNDPLQMPEITQDAAGAWIRRSLDYLREQRVDVVMETTLRDPDAVKQTLQAFRDAGYDTELRVIAVPEAVSRAGTFARYVNQVKMQGAGRWAPSRIHDQACAQAPETAALVIEQGLVDRIVVQKRDDVTMLDVGVHPSLRKEIASATRAAINDGRRIDQMTAAQAAQWLATVESTARFSMDTRESDRDILVTLRRLGADVPAVAKAAHPYDASAQVARAEAGQRATSLGALAHLIHGHREPMNPKEAAEWITTLREHTRHAEQTGQINTITAKPLAALHQAALQTVVPQLGLPEMSEARDRMTVRLEQTRDNIMKLGAPQSTRAAERDSDRMTLPTTDTAGPSLN